MKILQYAFNSDTKSEHLPINYDRNCCVYLGTHDNNTMLTAIEQMDEKSIKFLMKYLGKENLDDIVWDLIRAAYSSVANIVIIQMQDILELNNTARMNTPSTVGGNWKWRVTKNYFTNELSEKLCSFTKIYAR